MRCKISMYAGNCLLGCIFTAHGFAGQQDGLHAGRINAVQVKALLSRPGGLELLANREGTFILQDQPELFSDLSLAKLIEASRDIALVTIQSRSSRLTTNGDDIVTDYVFQPIEILKGAFAKHDTFSAPGGKIIFANGTSAEMVTVEWNKLAVGSQQILFLLESEDRYKLTNGVESAFQVLSDGTKLSPLARADESRPHAVLKDLCKHTPDSFKAFIRNRAAQTK